MRAHDADYGEVAQPGFLGRLFGRRPKIVKDANLAAAAASLPQGAGLIGEDPNGHWIVYEMPNGAQQVRFRAREAWLPSEPTATRNNTNITLATVHWDGRVVVLEGIHRTRAMARERVMIDPSRGGVEQAPGWLHFSYDPSTFCDTPSARATILLAADGTPRISDFGLVKRAAGGGHLTATGAFLNERTAFLVRQLGEAAHALASLPAITRRKGCIHTGASGRSSSNCSRSCCVSRRRHRQARYRPAVII